jgi:hypothetical protein
MVRGTSAAAAAAAADDADADADALDASAALAAVAFPCLQTSPAINLFFYHLPYVQAPRTTFTCILLSSAFAFFSFWRRRPVHIMVCDCVMEMCLAHFL